MTDIRSGSLVREIQYHRDGPVYAASLIRELMRTPDAPTQILTAGFVREIMRNGTEIQTASLAREIMINGVVVSDTWVPRIMIF